MTRPSWSSPPAAARRCRRWRPRLPPAGQFLPFEPPAFAGDPTLGGVIAAGLSGPRRMYAGAARDFVLGAGLLGADGELLRFGGQVMKNVAGFDVARAAVRLARHPRHHHRGLPQGAAAAAAGGDAAPGAEPRRGLLRVRALGGPAAAAVRGRLARGCAWVRLSGAAPAVQAARAQAGRGAHPPAAAHASGGRRCATAACRCSQSRSCGGCRCRGPAGRCRNCRRPASWTGAARCAGTPRRPTPTTAAAAAAVGGTALCWRGPAPQGRFHPLVRHQPGAAPAPEAALRPARHLQSRPPGARPVMSDRTARRCGAAARFQ